MQPLTCEADNGLYSTDDSLRWVNGYM